MCERINREIKRCTRVAGLFPNESSVLSLLIAILMLLALETALYFNPRPRLHLLGLGSLITTASLLVIIPPLLLRPLRRAALSAATRAGLKRV